MRRSTRSVSLLALGLTLCFTSACREPTTPKGKAPKGESQQADEVQLPDPLPLPAEPRAASWIAEPSRAIAMVAPYSPITIDPRAAAEQALAGLTEPALAGELSRAVDLRATFANVVLDDGQEVIRLSIGDEARDSIAGRLGELERVGEFGAVRLPTRPPPPGEVQRAARREWLAWIDEGDGGTLVLANSLEGLVTGRELGSAYGQQPIFFTAKLGSGVAALPIPAELPLSRVTGRGDLEHVQLEVVAADGQDPLAELPLSAGSLGGLLDAPNIAAGATGRYAEHEQAVRELTSRVNAQVRELPFFVRGVGEDLAAKLNTLARTWDGRTLVAVGPANHLRLAYGANDVAKSEVATIRLLQKVVENLSIARNFMARLPKLSLRRRVAKADGVDIELFVLYEAFSTVPAELRGLVDGESRLNVAMAWSESRGGGMIVVGPDAVSQLASWIERTKDAPDHRATAEQLLAASLAVDPAQLPGLVEGGELDFARVLGLAASGPKWKIEVVPGGGGRYLVDIRTPGPPKIPRAQSR